MRVKGKDWITKEDLDRAYYFFKQQIKNHHNSDPFRVKGVGEAAKENMDYLLERAKQDLNVYFVK